MSEGPRLSSISMLEYKTFQIILSDFNELCGTSFYASHHLFHLLILAFGLHGLIRSRDPSNSGVNLQSFMINVSTICLILIVEISDVKLSDLMITSAEKRKKFYKRQTFIIGNPYAKKKVAAMPVLQYKCGGPFFEVRIAFFLTFLQKCLEAVILMLTFF